MIAPPLRVPATAAIRIAEFVSRAVGLVAVASLAGVIALLHPGVAFVTGTLVAIAVPVAAWIKPQLLFSDVAHR